MKSIGFCEMNDFFLHRKTKHGHAPENNHLPVRSWWSHCRICVINIRKEEVFFFPNKFCDVRKRLHLWPHRVRAHLSDLSGDNQLEFPTCGKVVYIKTLANARSKPVSFCWCTFKAFPLKKFVHKASTTLDTTCCCQRCVTCTGLSLSLRGFRLIAASKEESEYSLCI